MAELPAEALFDELDSRQDDLLRQLDDLNSRIEQTLAENASICELYSCPSIGLDC